MIAIENITKSYGSNILLDQVQLRINPKERVGLVGRNGHGKTTLIRMIAGEEPVDDGVISIPKNYRIGYVRQHLDFKRATVIEEGLSGLPPQEADHRWKVEKVLLGLGFAERDFDRPPGSFSGGYQVRLNLAKILVSDPDLLLLDEPTNYLDITSIRWIIGFLNAWPREVILITHDRSFMDQTVTHIAGIHRRKIRKVEGDTAKYYSQIAQDEEIYEKTRLNDERRRKEVELFISRFRAKARLANLVQSRIKTLEKMGKKEKLDAIRTLDFSFRSLPFKGRHLLIVRELAFGYPDGRPLFSDLGFSVEPGDRICIIGKNGQGKTTLMRVLAEQLDAQSGVIQFNPNATVGYFEQTNIQSLHPDRSVEDEILLAAPDMDRQNARNICGAMMFRGDDALKKVSVLSGGEKSRVMLGKLLATPLNLLLLDEPTNHLDMDACDALLAALEDFAGAVVMVTHNELFLHAIANRLVVFQDGGATVFDGSYQRFLETHGWEGEDTRPPMKPVAEEKMSKKALRRHRSEIIARRGRELNPLAAQIEEVESIIDARETELASLQRQMQTASECQNAAKIAVLGRDICDCEEEIERRFDELERLTDILKAKEATFDRRLADLEAQG
ncbi:MAG: ABC-F family ATP-binding cassette domain-containing protein [Desulfobacterales bacterium]|jgi:ATP-binding cassette subfamily F protein 3